MRVLQALSALSASKQPVREAWATWNPQRAAVRDLQQQIEQGALTLEVSTLSCSCVDRQEITVAHAY